MTEEQADKVFELACEKYIEESRAVDRYIENRSAKLRKARKAIEDSSLPDEEKAALFNKYFSKAREVSSEVDGISTRPTRLSLTRKALTEKRKKDANAGVPSIGTLTKPGKDNIKYKDKKIDMTPAEEKQPGKYLDAYNKKKDKMVERKSKETEKDRILNMLNDL